MSFTSSEPASGVRDWRAARYERMLTAAVGVMQGRGAADVSMDEVARAAGVGKATLYRYFHTKENLLRACLAAIVDDIGARMEAAEAAAAPPPERLRRIIAVMVEAFSEHLLPLRPLLRGQNELDAEWRRSVQQARRRLVTVLGEHFERGRRDGVYRALDRELVPHLVMGMIRSAATHVDGVSNAALTEAVHDFALRACRSDGLAREPGTERAPCRS